VSVIVVTWRRPDSVQGCLRHLAELPAGPDETLVVDGSPDDLTAAAVEAFPLVRHLPFAGGAGHMTAARNVGLLHTSGEIVALLDDDAFVRIGWLEGLLAAFADPEVGAVAGRTCSPGDSDGASTDEPVGRLLANGDLTGNFGADLPGVIAVDHGIGANMAFRRGVLAELGGFRDDFGGTELREDADIFLRARSLGHRAVFAPRAAVDHIGAAHVKGQRFDYRYMFWGRHNHALLLARNFGLGSSELRRWVCLEIGRIVKTEHPRLLRRLARVGMGLAAVALGCVTSGFKAAWGPTDPRRYDRNGDELRRHLRADQARS
jgi:GT2 family glycosyltransferase